MVNDKYKDKRREAINGTLRYLRTHPNDEFTAAELANIAGLPVQSMVQGLLEKPISVNYRKKEKPVSYVRLDENGNVDYGHIMTFKKKIGVYSYRME